MNGSLVSVSAVYMNRGKRQRSKRCQLTLQLDKPIKGIEQEIRQFLASPKAAIRKQNADHETRSYSWNLKTSNTGELDLAAVNIGVLAQNVEFLEPLQRLLLHRLPALKLPSSGAKKIESHLEQIFKVLFDYARAEDIYIADHRYASPGNTKCLEHDWQSSDLFDGQSQRLSSEAQLLPVDPTSDLQFLPSD